LYAGLDSALFGITVTNFVYYYCQSAPFHDSTDRSGADVQAQGMSFPALSSRNLPARSS
jgi:hypothetical protein